MSETPDHHELDGWLEPQPSIWHRSARGNQWRRLPNCRNDGCAVVYLCEGEDLFRWVIRDGNRPPRYSPRGYATEAGAMAAVNAVLRELGGDR